jgi:gliding motility-associated-like protein
MWNWEPADNLTNANSANPIVETFDGFPTEYVAFVEPIGLENCATTDTVLVVPGFMFTTNFSNPTCVLTDGTIAVEIDEPPSEGPWTIELFENGMSVETVISNGGLDVFDDLTEGNYSVELSDAIGCEYTVPFVLSPPQPMDFDLTPNPNICINGFATLETSSDMDPGQAWTYSWDNGLGTGDVQVVNPIVDTDYTVFATDANGCTSDAQTVTVQVYDSLNVSISAPDLICGGAFAELEADVFNGGSGAGYSFNWSWQNNPVGGDESYWVDYPQATGTYCVTLTDNCESPAVTECEEVVIETPIPAAFTSDTTRSCVPGVFQFESLVDPALIAQTEWFFGDGELSYDANPAHAYLSPGSYDITFNITSLVGCEYVNFQPNYLQVFTPPYVGFTATPQPTRVPDTEIQFESVNSTNVVDWFWLFDSIQYLGASNQPNPLFEFPIDQGGNYPVTLVVTDENGCSSQITRTIEVLDLFSLYIPTAFSPNNDGTNDAFFAVGTDIDPARFSMQVINRWGNLVFETTDVNEVWYGKSNDASEHFAQDGVYFYRVVVYSLSNPAERKEIKGAVSLMR